MQRNWLGSTVCQASLQAQGPGRKQEGQSLRSCHFGLPQRVVLAPLSKQATFKLPVFSTPASRLGPGHAPPFSGDSGESPKSMVFFLAGTAAWLTDRWYGLGRMSQALPPPLTLNYRGAGDSPRTSQPQGHFIKELFTVENVRNGVLEVIF